MQRRLIGRPVRHALLKSWNRRLRLTVEALQARFPRLKALQCSEKEAREVSSLITTIGSRSSSSEMETLDTRPEDRLEEATEFGKEIGEGSVGREGGLSMQGITEAG